jgi:HK97 gp10 family phage protein
MAKSRYTIEGLDTLRSKLHRLSATTIGDVAKEAFPKAANPMVDRIQSLAPVRTGKLRSAIRVRAFINDQGNASFRISIGIKNFVGDTFYGAMQEFGTVKMEAKHFMKRGFEETESQVAETAMRLIASGIENEMRR